MKLKLHQGTTQKLCRIFIQDSTSTSGAGLTGLTSGSAGLTFYYAIEGVGATVAVTLSAGTLGTWSSGGFVAVDAAHMPGVYEVGLPNLMLASGASVIGYLQGATNMVPCLLEIELDAVNYQSATSFVASVPAVVGAVGSVTGNVGGSVASVTAPVTAGTVSDKTGYALTTAPPTAAAIATQVATTLGLPVVDGGTVSASPSPTTTTFTATGALHAPSGGYTIAPQSVYWQTGANQGIKVAITGHTVTGSNHAFTTSAVPNAPSTADTFIII